MKLNDKNILDLCKGATKTIDDKKLENIVLLNLKEKSSIADFFIIATASSGPQMRAGIDYVYRYFKDNGITPYGNNDNKSSDSLWALIDYGFLVVHIFTEEGREYYNLDELFSDAEKIDF